MLRLSGSGLSCIRGFRSVFTGINFELLSGQALALIGPNGAGKSSLLRLIAGLLQPAAGRIALEGGAAERTLAEQAHYLGHLDAFKPALTVAENLDFWARYLGDAAPVTRPALASVGLDGLADLPAGYLSAGQRRRLSLARLIAVPRPVWLLDEPSCGARFGRAGHACRAHAGAFGRRAGWSWRRRMARWGSTARSCDWGTRHDPPRRPAGARHAPCRARRRRRADGRAVLPHRGDDRAVRDRPGRSRCCGRSAPRSSGSAPCSPRCSRSTGCSPPTMRTARSISC